MENGAHVDKSRICQHVRQAGLWKAEAHSGGKKSWVETLTGERMLDFEIFPHTSTTPISGISLLLGVVGKIDDQRNQKNYPIQDGGWRGWTKF